MDLTNAKSTPNYTIKYFNSPSEIHFYKKQLSLYSTRISISMTLLKNPFFPPPTFPVKTDPEPISLSYMI